MSEAINNKIKHLQYLLDIEKKADLEQYIQSINAASYKDQVSRGVCWYPVSIGEIKYDAGERLIVKLNRAIQHEAQHQFQSGKPVRLFSGIQNNSELFVNGVVNYVKNNEMAITLNCDEMPDWTGSGKIGVQLLFDENTYKEMEYALSKLLTSEEDNHLKFKNILFGERDATFDETEIVSSSSLNESQNVALNTILTANDIAIVHGPPGTGKTTTLVQSILYVLKHESQIMVTAPSNAAVDLLVEKLMEQGVNVVRIGHPARVTDEILSTTLDAKISNHDYYKELRAIRKQSEEYHRMAHKYKRNFGKSEREQRRALFAEARKLDSEAGHLSFYISNDIISKAQVIACTLVGSANYALKGMKLSSVFIDEAAQALEPACWIPILKAQKIIFAGDHCQLPPTVKSYEAAKMGLSVTLFEKIINHPKASNLLCEQYRMNSKIMEFSNREFYDSKLIAHTSVANHKVFEDDVPIEFIDTAGTGFWEQQDEDSKSTFNREEADLLLKYFINFVENNLHSFNEIITVGIIAPYRAQIKYLQEIFAGIEKEEMFTNIKISVNTIDSFQGQERDMIFISLTRSNETGEIGFLSDIRRMNVAMTRAKKKLVVVGDSSTIVSHPYYDRFVAYVTEIEAYKSAFELMY